MPGLASPCAKPIPPDTVFQGNPGYSLGSAQTQDSCGWFDRSTKPPDMFSSFLATDIPRGIMFSGFPSIKLLWPSCDATAEEQQLDWCTESYNCGL